MLSMLCHAMQSSALSPAHHRLIHVSRRQAIRAEEAYAKAPSIVGSIAVPWYTLLDRQLSSACVKALADAGLCCRRIARDGNCLFGSAHAWQARRHSIA